MRTNSTIMQNLLVPTDFSEYSNAALEYAVYIAKIRESTIHVISVVLSNNKGEFEQVKEKMLDLKKDPKYEGISIETYVKLDGAICDEILECAQEVKANLILMGSHGSSTITEILLGSNTEKVVRKSNFNVLTIKHSMIRENIKSIAFASDFSRESNQIFGTIRDIADKLNANVHLLKINTPTHFEPTRVSMEKINKFIENEKLSPLTGDKYKVALYSDSTEELGVLNYCIENEIDIIALGIHNKTSIWKLLHESTSQNLVSHSFRPVLTIPISE